MIDRSRTGIFADHDSRHYSFCRDSKLPRGTFDDPRKVDILAWAVVALLGTLTGLAAIYIGSII